MPGSTAASARFFGTWFTNLGPLVLFPDPAGVAGKYERRRGELRGALAGGVLHGTWADLEGSGPPEGDFTLELDPTGNHLRGERRLRDGSGWREPWAGVRTALLPRSAGGHPGAENSLAQGPLLSGPLLGEVSGDEALVWAQAREEAPLTLVLHTPGGPIEYPGAPRWDEWLCTTFRLRGLVPGQEYDYEVRGPGGSTPRHRLRAGPSAGAERARLAFGSCFNHWERPHLPIFDAIRGEGADAMVMLGDNCYLAEPDWQTQHTRMLAYLRHRNNLSFQRLAAQVPMLAIWDDHDFGPNDSDGTFAGKDDSLAVFQRCWAQRGAGLAGTPGIFSTVRLGPVEIFLTDGRYHRGVEGDTVLGTRQQEWLRERLRASAAPVKIVASGTVLLGHLPIYRDWESWRRSAPGELEELISFIEAEDIRGVVFLSGDLHMAFVRCQPGRDLGDRRGPDLWEVTSSPLAIEPENAWAPWPDATLIHQTIDRGNYGVIDVDLSRAGAEVRLLLKDSDGRVLFEQAVALNTLQVR